MKMLIQVMKAVVSIGVCCMLTSAALLAVLGLLPVAFSVNISTHLGFVHDSQISS